MEFTQQLYTQVQPVLQQILNCSFVQGLASGTLPFSAFAHYLAQDILYLQQDSKALMLLSQKAPDKEQQLFFQTLANDGINMEKALHDEFLSFYNIPEAREQSPAFKAYGEFLVMHSQHSSYEVAAAALLPCFWIYTIVGKNILENNTPSNKYQKFIDTYAGDEYVQFTNQFINIVEKIAFTATNKTKLQMMEAFMQGSRFELSVFEEAITF